MTKELAKPCLSVLRDKVVFIDLVGLSWEWVMGERIFHDFGRSARLTFESHHNCFENKCLEDCGLEFTMSKDLGKKRTIRERNR
jgi:hypothetical protein